MGDLSFALFLHDSTNNYQLLLREDAQRTAHRHGHTVSVYSADKNADLQQRQIQGILSGAGKMPAAILISPVRESALLGVARDALARGIPWVFLCRSNDALRAMRIAHRNVPAFAILADQDAIGRLQGRLLRQLLRPGDDIVYIQGPMGTSSADRRFAATHRELVGTSVRWSKFRGDWSVESGRIAMTTWLQAFPESTLPAMVVAGQNDEMALGARQALIEKIGHDRRAVDGLQIVGCDGLPNFGVRMVSEGLLSATVVVPSVAGRAIEELLSAFATGKQPSAEVVVDVSSYPSVDAVVRKALPSPSESTRTPSLIPKPDPAARTVPSSALVAAKLRRSR